MNENEPHISASCTPDGEVKFEIIPRDKEIEERQKSQIQKVGPYCRVSTLSEQQETSYEQQRLHYTEYVERHPGWELVDIYADHGISATSTKRRKAFNRLIADCKNGAVTYIITKQVSRFARNTADCVRICRELKKLACGGVFRDRGAEHAVPKQRAIPDLYGSLGPGGKRRKVS